MDQAQNYYPTRKHALGGSKFQKFKDTPSAWDRQTRFSVYLSENAIFFRFFCGFWYVQNRKGGSPLKKALISGLLKTIKLQIPKAIPTGKQQHEVSGNIARTDAIIASVRF